MKKIFLIFMFFLGAYYVKAIELTYSEWSEEYPNGVDEILIESEDRYLWYKETVYDVEYLIKEEAEKKIYDSNDYIFYESEELYEMPLEYSERIINSYNKLITYNSKDANGLLLQSEDNIMISEILIYDKNGNQVEFISERPYLNDNIKDVYYPLNNKLKVTFNQNYDMTNLKIYIYYNYYEHNTGYLKVSIVTNENDEIYFVDYHYNYANSFGCSFDVNINVLQTNFYHNKKVYTYRDKLYKSYRINREYFSEYSKELEGFIKDLETKKIFYRYITNKYLIFDSGYNIVTDESICDKEFCMIIFFDSHEPTPEEPKEQPAIEEPTPEEPKEEPAIEEPTPEEPKEEPAIEEPTPEEPKEETAIEEPTPEEPKEEPAIEEPTPEEPKEEPVIEEPTLEESQEDIIEDNNEENMNLLNEIIINPKTYDSLYDYIVLFVVSIIALIYFIVEKGRTKNNSNNVETI